MEEHSENNAKGAPTGQTKARNKIPWLWIIPIPVALVIGLLIGAQLPDSDLTPAAASPSQTAPPAQAPNETGAEESSPAAANPDESAPEVPDMARLDADDPTAVGEVDAPVVMVTYSDLQCPFCAKWTDGTLPELMDKYVDTGQLRIEWRDLDLFGDTSKTAALAAQAAAMQDGYAAFQSRMAQGGKIAKESAYTDDSLKDIAKELGMDPEKFITDMDSSQAKDAVQRNIDEAMSLAVMSTPSFLINQTPFVGAQPTENFIKAIDAELEKTEGEAK
ncbi:DsbA family protein [Paeniglutamicibacter antarcticus]|uniref:Thioredoxin domain-containing protein n=1 Tax=Paeniglutamicibacter antarcticus TaxID=494023 RepID=A0ABP9THS1_9MICC